MAEDETVEIGVTPAPEGGVAIGLPPEPLNWERMLRGYMRHVMLEEGTPFACEFHKKELVDWFGMTPAEAEIVVTMADQVVREEREKRNG
jgi:hypothetical protein